MTTTARSQEPRNKGIRGVWGQIVGFEFQNPAGLVWSL